MNKIASSGPPSKMFIVHLYVRFIFERSLKMVNSAMRIVRANLNLFRQGVLFMLLDLLQPANPNLGSGDMGSF